MSLRFGAIASLLMLGMPLSATAAGVLFIDENMANGAAAFDSFFLSIDDSDGNLSIDVQDGAPGNPGDGIEVLHFHDPVAAPDGNPGGYSIQSVHEYNLLTWDPVVDGAIQSVSFSIDIESGSEILDVYFTMGQGGSGSFAGFTEPVLAGGFETIAVPGLTSADFGGIDFAGGGPIRFGFGMITQSMGNLTDEFDGDQFAANFDNFQVTVTAVPLPASAWLLALPLLSLARRRG